MSIATCKRCGHSFTRLVGYACPKCHAAYCREWRKRNPDKVRIANAKARAKDQTKERRRASQRKRYRESEELRARYEHRKAFWKAVKRGDIRKEPCAICGTEERVVAHHKTLSSTFDVVWFCRDHYFETFRRKIP